MDTLDADIDRLHKVLNHADPGWFERELRAVTDARGIVTEGVCLPIRAAIRLITGQ